MEQFVGKRVKIRLNIDGVELFYTANVISVSNSHILFKDKFNKTFCYRLLDVIEISD